MHLSSHKATFYTLWVENEKKERRLKDKTNWQGLETATPYMMKKPEGRIPNEAWRNRK